MKLATFEHRGAGRGDAPAPAAPAGSAFGVVTDGGLRDVRALWPDGPVSLLAALRAGRPALQRIADLAAGSAPTIPLAEVRLLAPIPEPPKVLGLAVNYAAHHRESSQQALPDDPRLTTTPRPFLMPATAICGPGDEIPWPAYSKTIDYEVELAVVIGRTAKCVSPDAARDCIAGYTIANDISARTAAHAEGRTPRDKDAFFDWLHSKWADGFCPTGPWLVTADEIADPGSLDIELTVNGQTRQQANTSQMIFSVYELVSFISHLTTLVPGDLIATGTPSGVGMTTGAYLQAGDAITCRIEKIGELTNTLGPAPQTFYTPCRP